MITNTELLAEWTEHDHQVQLFTWADHCIEQDVPNASALANLFAIPNGGERNAIVGAKMKAEGVKPGVPDMFLAHPVRVPFTKLSGNAPTAPGLFVELKSLRPGARLSPAQREWLERLSHGGYLTASCEGWIDAARLIAYCLSLGPAATKAFGLGAYSESEVPA